MATISTEKVYLKTGTEFKKKITYSKGLFRLQLPEELCVDLCYTDQKDKEITGKSEVEVDGLWKAKLIEWGNAVTVTTKVIIFEAKFQGGLLKEDVAERWNGNKKYKPFYKNIGYAGNDGEHHYFNKYDVSTFDIASLGMLIQWAVYDKIQFKDKIDYKFVSGRKFDSHNVFRGKLSGGMTEIEHTEDREQFFLDLDESFARMIAKVYKALGDLTPEKLELLADSKLKLLGN